ncbi:MAG: methylated-DNA--[protein]-cysteine S-methyltransferase [Bacteroidaceae bacterium]|nr:methylated-DNA--[protein]-cysteine S-methyltransferase [Bacteroidaceae bacterium]
MDYTASYNSPLGGITMASDGKALFGLWFDGQKYFANTLNDENEERPDLPIFDETRRWLDLYFSGKVPDFTPPLLMRASPFRQNVWQRLLEIPFGHTTTYSNIARSVGCKSAQAVGGAVGHNSILLIIPCHRVVGSKGLLTGYAGGLDKKASLLKLETGINLSGELFLDDKPRVSTSRNTNLQAD